MTAGPGSCCLALVTDAFGGCGGIAQYNRDFLAALAACPEISGVAVRPRRGEAPASLPDRIAQAPARRGRLGYAIGAVLAACRRPPGIVFCGHLFMTPLAAAIAWFAQARLVVQMHGVEAWAAPSRARRRAVERADLVLCVSRHTRAAVLAWADVPPERVIVVPNTVADDFTPGDGSALRAASGLDGKRILLTVGRLDPRERYKGHDRLIEAIAHLVERGHDIAYVVIGDGEDRHRLGGLARRLNLSERVHFTGAVPRETLVQGYRMADLYVMPSTGEGFGIAFIEAMACGTPALGLAVAGASDALGDGALGTATSEPELAAAIDRLLAAPRPPPHALAARVRARFGRAALHEQVEAAVHRVLAAGGRPRMTAR